MHLKSTVNIAECDEIELKDKEPADNSLSIARQIFCMNCGIIYKRETDLENVSPPI